MVAWPSGYPGFFEKSVRHPSISPQFDHSFFNQFENNNGAFDNQRRDEGPPPDAAEMGRITDIWGAAGVSAASLRNRRVSE